GNMFILTGLNPEEKDTVRVRAFNAGGYSGYSNELVFKTKPVPVPVLDLATYIPDMTWSGVNSAVWDKTSANWISNNIPVAFTDSSKVLFTNSSVKNITLNDAVGIKAMVVNADSSFTFSGNGAITGTGSLNKTGVGALTLRTINTYTGATVLYNGTLNVPTLANGGVASSIGASKNYDFNLVLKGGKLNYIGASASTDRNIKLEGNAGIGVSASGVVLTSTGIINGSGGITKTGTGSLLLKGLNTYEGTTTVSEGMLEINGADAINNAFSADKSYILNGGYLKTSGGSTTVYENYYSNFVVPAGCKSSFEPFRNCYIYSKFSGNGNLNFNLTYVREYIQGDWTQFSGTVYANGTGTTTDGNQFMLNNTVGIPNARIVTSGNTKIICWKNASTMYLGGLSGPSGTYLAGSDKINNSATMTWVVGGAGTDETFNGIINNECSNKSYKGITSIVKEGKGYWKLTGANIYSGTTTVTGGTLIVNGTQTGTGKVTVMTDASLAGKGTIPAAVEVQSGATLHPGDPSVTATNIGTLTVGSLNLLSGSELQMDINRSLSQNDKVVSTGAVILGGTLNLLINETPQAGDQYTLMTASSFSGVFTQIVPETPGAGLKWTFSNGVLKVDLANGIDRVENSSVKIYPNPVQSSAEVLLGQSYDQAVVTLESVNGTVVFQKTISNTDRVKVNMVDCASGVYVIRVKAGARTLLLQKVVKQ
ncbi:MAG: autotransporter-associated beta strand repeat-containing protein, partial [Bacteroidota bacterium]|nr:autotransporter-associated beta strand repeat-containing protein [Bacteroidota bacterium]